MIRSRHTKGRVLDLNSEVCPRSFLDNSTVGEDADVYISNLTNSWTDNSKIVHSVLTNSDVRQSDVAMAVVIGSDVINSTVYDGSVLSSKVEGVTLRGGVITGCTIDADVVVGNAVLDGLTITESMRVGEGYWTRVPRRFELNDEVVSGVVVTESTDGYAYIGCERKLMTRWIKGKDRFGKAAGWSKEMTDYIASRFEEWLKDGNV